MSKKATTKARADEAIRKGNEAIDEASARIDRRLGKRLTALGEMAEGRPPSYKPPAPPEKSPSLAETPLVALRPQPA